MEAQERRSRAKRQSKANYKFQKPGPSANDELQVPPHFMIDRKERTEMEVPRWVNEKVVSEFTGLALQTLRNRRFMGLAPPYHKISRGVRYRVSDVIEFMESKKVLPRIEE